MEPMTRQPREQWLNERRTALLVGERIAKSRLGFLTDDDVAAIAADPSTRFTRCLVRCGGGRFIAAAQDVAHFLKIIEREGSDYIRDVSLF